MQILIPYTFLFNPISLSFLNLYIVYILLFFHLIQFQGCVVNEIFDDYLQKVYE